MLPLKIMCKSISHAAAAGYRQQSFFCSQWYQWLWTTLDWDIEGCCGDSSSKKKKKSNRRSSPEGSNWREVLKIVIKMLKFSSSRLVTFHWAYGLIGIKIGLGTWCFLFIFFWVCPKIRCSPRRNARQFWSVCNVWNC